MAELDGVMPALGHAAVRCRHSYFNQMRDEQPDKIGAGRSYSQDIGAIPRDCSKACSTCYNQFFTTKLIRRFGTTTSFTICFPSRRLATRGSARTIRTRSAPESPD